MDPLALNGKQLEELRSLLGNYVRKHFPGLRHEADDVVAQSISDLWEYLGGRAGQLREGEIRPIAVAILKRRAADMFRAGAKEWALEPDALPQSEPIDPASADLPKSLLYQKMLRVCIAELADVSAEDDLLLSMVAGAGPDQQGALDANHRQRLHRLRKRLGAAILRELGEEARALLRDGA